MDHSQDYDEGLRDGRLRAIEAQQSKHTEKFDDHESRLILIERIIYGMAGVLFLSAIWPKLETVIDAIAR